MATATRNYNKKLPKNKPKSKKDVKSSVITVRISNEEKERINEIMMGMDIRRYSDVMRMALHMMKTNSEYTWVNMQ